MEIKDVTKAVFFAVTDPSLITVDFADLDRQAKERRAKRDAVAPPPGKGDLHKEYNHLRQRLFDLKQDAKTYEIRTNECAGKIHLLEQHINEALQLKKAAADAGNLRGERMYEHQVQNLETELVDARQEFDKNKQWSVRAARALRAFDGAARIEELKALLGVKSTDVPK